MKTLSSFKVNKVRQGVLAGILALSGSASTLAAVPQAPLIEWIEATEQFTESGEYVEVDLQWSRDDVDDVSSIQVRLDGKPVMSRAVDIDQTFGDAFVAIEETGEFDLTVALCNADGCSETAPVTISISREGGVDVEVNPPTDPDAFEQADPGLSAGAPDDTPVFQLDEFQQQGAVGISGLASEFGKFALSEIASNAGSMVFDEVMSAIGLGGVDVSEQISELQSSLNAMSAQITKLTEMIDELYDKTVWGDFLDEHDLANEHVNNIYGYFEDVLGYIDQGVEPDYNEWTEARTAFKKAVNGLAASGLNPGNGIVDRKDGAIYQLMSAVPQSVATVESYWPIIEQYRDYYRAGLAMGFLGLDLIADHYDGSGTTRIKADNALNASQTAVLNMYAYGIAPELPVSGTDVLGLVHLRGSTVGYAAADYAKGDEDATKRLAGLTLSNALKEMKSKFNPQHHDDMTFEELLIESNVPTAYFIDNSNGFKSTGWELHLVKSAQPHLELPPLWRVRPRVTQIKDTVWTEQYVSFCPANPDLCNGNASDEFYSWYNDYGGLKYEKEILDKIAARKSAARANGGFLLPTGEFAESHYASIDLTDRLNHGGRPANFDEDAVRIAAFGDGSVSLPHGSLPGAEEDSECIGLPEQDLTILEAGDYQLKWLQNGNLVLRDDQPGNLWATKTANRSNELCWKLGGNLVVRQGGSAVWASKTADGQSGGYGGRELKLYPDGALQIVNELDKVIWKQGPFE